jgi:hypothetical protein
MREPARSIGICAFDPHYGSDFLENLRLVCPPKHVSKSVSSSLLSWELIMRPPYIPEPN